LAQSSTEVPPSLLVHDSSNDGFVGPGIASLLGLADEFLRNECPRHSCAHPVASGVGPAPAPVRVTARLFSPWQGSDERRRTSAATPLAQAPTAQQCIGHTVARSNYPPPPCHDARHQNKPDAGCPAVPSHRIPLSAGLLRHQKQWFRAWRTVSQTVCTAKRCEGCERALLLPTGPFPPTRLRGFIPYGPLSR
jgi:hypothetical protein